MKYLLLCGFEEHRWHGMSESEQQKVMEAYCEVVGSLRESGHYLGGNKLEQSGRAVSVRERNGESLLTDGPFAETKEQLGGYHLLECRDMREAISIAKRIPTLPVGGVVEVRAISEHQL